MRDKNFRPPGKSKAAKVPVVMQMEALECGAACLAMVLACYGKWMPLEQVRVDCGVSRDGSRAGNIMKAARSYGLEAKGYRMGLEAVKGISAFPCIIHWNLNHFVVLCGFRGNHACINDPARGSVKVTMDEFDKAFTGIVMVFAPTERFEPDGKRTSTLAFARKRLSGAGAAMVFVMLTSIIGYVFTLQNSAFSRFFMDRLLTGENSELLTPFIALVAAVSLLQVFVTAIRAVYSLKINGKMAVVGSGSFMWKVLKMPMEFFSQRMAGDLLTRHKANETIAEQLVNTLTPLALSAVMMVFYLVVMLRYSPILTLVGLVSILINIVMSRIISEKRINITRVQTRDAGRLMSATVSGIRMVETIKASGAENGYFRRWAGFQASVNQQNVKLSRLNQTYGTIPAFITTLANALVLVLGIHLCMRGQFTLGMVTAFQSFLASFISPAMTMVTAGQTLQEMRTQMERVEDVMEYPEDKNTAENPDAEEKLEKLSGTIELKNVTFGYSRLAEPLIKDFSLSMKTGDRIALVGASGCGKSTISKLVSGMYEPWSGEILFDGKPRSAYPRDVMVGSLAVVDQDIILFEDTIENNIKMWDDTIMDFEVILAARDAQIHDDIVQMPGGYRHKLTSGGRNLSGGQRQRLEIARVLAQDPTIIILDEATSALDAKTEYEVVNAIRDRGITCIVIAHRLSTVRDCDEIIVLDKGKAVERGTHDELMALGGAYADLVANE